MSLGWRAGSLLVGVLWLFGACAQASNEQGVDPSVDPNAGGEGGEDGEGGEGGEGGAPAEGGQGGSGGATAGKGGGPAGGSGGGKGGMSGSSGQAGQGGKGGSAGALAGAGAGGKAGQGSGGAGAGGASAGMTGAGGAAPKQIDVQLKLPPPSAAFCKDEGVVGGDCASGLVCRIYAYNEGRCEGCGPCAKVGEACTASVYCGVNSQCYGGICRELCQLGAACKSGGSCKDVGNESAGVCVP